MKNARDDTCSRNIMRHEDLAEHVELARVKNHFICEFFMRIKKIFFINQ